MTTHRDPHLPLTEKELAAIVSLPKPRKIKPLSPIKTVKLELSLADYLMGLSKFGGTTLEKLVDGAAATLGIVFDYAQFYITLIGVGEYTKVDRVIMATRTLIYIDGPQHTMRPETETRDRLVTYELESMGWHVVRLAYLDLLRDPIGTVRRILYAF